MIKYGKLHYSVYSRVALQWYNGWIPNKDIELLIDDSEQTRSFYVVVTHTHFVWDTNDVYVLPVKTLLSHVYTAFHSTCDCYASTGTAIG